MKFVREWRLRLRSRGKRMSQVAGGEEDGMRDGVCLCARTVARSTPPAPRAGGGKCLRVPHK